MLQHMPLRRGRAHTSLTETATLVVRELTKLPHITLIAPGEIRVTKRRKSGRRHVTGVITNAGLELIITGQSVQRVAVHTSDPAAVLEHLKTAKSLRDFAVATRERKPGI